MIEQILRNMLASDEMGERLVASHEVDDVVAFMIESKIDPQKLADNLAALFDGYGRALGTPSLNPSDLLFFHGLLGSPFWLMAGFPDVLAWLKDNEAETDNAIAELYGFDVDSSDDDIKNPDGKIRARYNFNLVRNYIAQTGRSLEVAVEEGSKGDIYAANDFLQLTGEESTFTLIATKTTKCYMELKARYASSFPDETSLLAMSGILDAQSYILRGQIQPTQIVDLAKATHGETDRFLEFVIQFEALLFSVDTPELSPDEVLNACRDQAKAIQRSIRSAMETYRGEANIADDARALMTLTQFSQLRNAAGVRTPTRLEMRARAVGYELIPDGSGNFRLQDTFTDPTIKRVYMHPVPRDFMPEVELLIRLDWLEGWQDRDSERRAVEQLSENGEPRTAEDFRSFQA